MPLRPRLRAAAALLLLLAGISPPASADEWDQAIRVGDVVHVPVRAGAPRIDRYDLAAKSWLAPIPLPASPRAAAVTPDAIYVMESIGRIRRLSADGSQQLWMSSTGSQQFAVDPSGFVFALHESSNIVTVLDADTGGIVDAADLGDNVSFRYLTVASGIRKLFFLRSNGLEHWLASASYDASGTIGAVTLSEPLPVESARGPLSIFPDEDLVGTARGWVADAQTLEWRNTLFGEATDLAFDGDMPVRLEGLNVWRYAPGYETVGQGFAAGVVLPRAIEVRNGEAFVFDGYIPFPPGPPPPPVVLALDEIVYPPLEAPFDPPEPAVVEPLELDEPLTLTYPIFLPPSIHRWSFDERAFVAAASLRRYPVRIVECPATGGLLTIHPGGEIRAIADDATEETHWRNVPESADAVACTADYVVVATPSGRLATYTPAGEIVHSIAIGEPGIGADWVESRRRYYLFERIAPDLDFHLSAYTIDEDGVPSFERRGADASPSGVIDALEEAPFVFALGQVYDDATLTMGPYLGGHSGAAWLDGLLFTVVDDAVHAWDASYAQVQRGRSGTSGLFLRSGKLVAVGNDGHGGSRIFALAPDDIDEDGVALGDDAFPNDPLEWADGDGDGFGDNGDAFPGDAGEWVDSDGDGFGNNADPFDFDPTEWSDRDGDFVGDNGDPFPDDGSEWSDRDGDGHGDNGDWRPDDPAEWVDSDGDQVGDNADAFPLDPNESRDYDEDGIGDRSDPFPIGEPLIGLVEFTGKERAVFSQLGAVSRALPVSNLGLLPEGVFSLCGPEGGCVFGAHRPADTRGRRFELEVDPDFIAAIEPALEEALENVLSRGFRRDVTLDLVLRPEDARARVKLGPSGKHGVLKVKWVFDATLGNVPGPYRRLRFALVWKFQRADVVRP